MLVIGLDGFPSIEFDTSVFNLSYVLLLRFVLADSYLQDMFLALKMFVLEGQDLNTRPSCLFLLQDVLLPSRMTYLFSVQLLLWNIHRCLDFSSKVTGFHCFPRLLHG